MLRAIIAVIVIVCLTGCTSMQVMDRPAAASLRQKIEVGDQVSVLTRTNRHFDLKVTRIDEGAFIGRDTEDKPWKVGYDQIEQLQVEKTSWGKTAGLTVGIVVVVLGGLIYLGARAFENDLDHLDDNDD